MNLFSKWFKDKPRCRHDKKFGEDMPENMVKVLDVDLEWKDSCSVYQCKICGFRGFACCGLFICSSNHLQVIENFQKYRITLEELLKYLDKNKINYRLNK